MIVSKITNITGFLFSCFCLMLTRYISVSRRMLLYNLSSQVFVLIRLGVRILSKQAEKELISSIETALAQRMLYFKVCRDNNLR